MHPQEVRPSVKIHRKLFVLAAVCVVTVDVCEDVQGSFDSACWS
jgi:hypothetical protein